jgi:hypothetical protein
MLRVIRAQGRIPGAEARAAHHAYAVARHSAKELAKRLAQESGQLAEPIAPSVTPPRRPLL